MAKIKTKRKRVKFASDNVTGACPEVLDAIIKANDGDSAPYGNDQISIDLQSQLISCADQPFSFEVEAFLRYCLLNGLEQLDFLLGQMPQIKQYEKKYSKEPA